MKLLFDKGGNLFIEYNNVFYELVHDDIKLSFDKIELKNIDDSYEIKQLMLCADGSVCDHVDDSDPEPYVCFYQDPTNTCFAVLEDDSYPTLYDTYIYKNNRLCGHSELVNDSPIYRICIYLDKSQIIIKQIIGKTHIYLLGVKDNELHVSNIGDI